MSPSCAAWFYGRDITLEQESDFIYFDLKPFSINNENLAIQIKILSLFVDKGSIVVNVLHNREQWKYIRCDIQGYHCQEIFLAPLYRKTYFV